MQILALRINSTTNKVTDFTGQNYSEVRSVNGDVVLIAAQFFLQDLDGATIENDLSGSLAVRATVGLDRQEGTQILAFQDLYNTGEIPSNEDLSIGRVTWLLSLDSPDIVTALDTNEFIDVILELTILTADDLPQTLAQVFYRIYAQVDDGAVGTPPPTTPTYMDSATALATFVAKSNYIVPNTVAVNTVLTAIDGLQLTYVDTSGGDIDITLPLASTAPSRYRPAIVNTGANKIRFFTTGGDLINATASPAGEFEILTLFAGVELIVDGANNRYVSSLQVIP